MIKILLSYYIWLLEMIPMFVVIVFSIFFHELGHYVFAKREDNYAGWGLIPHPHIKLKAVGSRFCYLAGFLFSLFVLPLWCILFGLETFWVYILFQMGAAGVDFVVIIFYGKLKMKSRTSSYFKKDDVAEWWSPSKISIGICNWILHQEDWNRKTVLEIGCGNGDMLNLLRLEGASVTGIDVCKAMLLSHRKDVILTDALSLPFSSCSFDVIVSVEAFCHIQDKDSLFSEICRVLKPDGVGYLQTENSKSFHRLKLALYDSYHLFRDGTKLMFNMKPEEFKTLLADHNLISNHTEFFYGNTKFVVKCQKGASQND